MKKILYGEAANVKSSFLAIENELHLLVGASGSVNSRFSSVRNSSIYKKARALVGYRVSHVTITTRYVA